MKGNITAWILAIIGVFLAIDGFFLHGLTFDYSILNMGWLDPWIHHGIMGIMFALIGGYEIYNG